MSRISQTGLAAHKTPAPTPTGGKHFDTFETKFFEQGEAGDGERFDDLDDSHYAPRRPPLRWFLLGAATGGLVVAVLGGAALWFSGAHFGQPSPEATAAKVAAAEPVSPPAAPAPVAPAPAPAVVAAEPAAPAVAVNDDPPAAPTPTAAVAPAPAPSPAPKAAVVAAPSPEPKAAVVAAPAAPVAPAPAPSAKPVVAALPGLGPMPAAPAVSADPASARCKKAIDGKRGKDILGACPAAFAAEPSAETAVALAKVEFDRGRAVKALEWGRKAVALDANAADAYVFIGGGEQMAGHDKAAKDAYRRYLELAPTGRYAKDVRSIVGSAK